MLMVGDPVGMGIVPSLGRPGGNVTGLSLAFPELEAKRASLLHELMPAMKRVGVLFNPNNPYFKLRGAERDAAYRAAGLSPTYIEVTS